MDNISYRIIRSGRRTIAIEITSDGEVLVRCPRRMGTDAIYAFVQSKSQWIAGHLEKRKVQPRVHALTGGELQDLVQKARELLACRVAYYAPLVGVTYGKVAVRRQRSLWGSCSDKGNLSFNCLLMLTPPEVADYIVVHELCHRKEMNHSAKFWAEVARVLPDYRERQVWLRENGPGLMKRLQCKNGKETA